MQLFRFHAISKSTRVTTFRKFAGILRSRFYWRIPVKSIRTCIKLSTNLLASIKSGFGREKEKEGGKISSDFRCANAIAVIASCRASLLAQRRRLFSVSSSLCPTRKLHNFMKLSAISAANRQFHSRALKTTAAAVAAAAVAAGLAALAENE